MALKMQERMGELREKWLNEGFADPFSEDRINTGYCNVGTLQVSEADVYDYWRRGQCSGKIRECAEANDLDEL